MTVEFYKKLLTWIKQGQQIKFYKSKEWREVRKRVIVRDHYECQECKKQGKFNKVANVHHIEELNDNPMRALDESNLISLCVDCHNKIHKKSFKKEKKFTNIERW